MSSLIIYSQPTEANSGFTCYRLLLLLTPPRERAGMNFLGYFFEGLSIEKLLKPGLIKYQIFNSG